MPVSDAELAAFATSHDIISLGIAADEERRRLELRVQQAQKLETLATLAGGVAHDFNNLLQAITSNVELVRASGPMTSGIHGFLDQIEAASERASDLIRTHGRA